MISLETAKKLKDAGLQWEPQKGDWIYNHHGYVPGTITTLDLVAEDTVLIHSIAKDYQNRTVEFAPRLDQLLAEIDRREYWWSLYHHSTIGGEKEYRVNLSKKYNTSIPEMKYLTDSPEEAAAQALLWILGQKEGR